MENLDLIQRFIEKNKEKIRFTDKGKFFANKYLDEINKVSDDALVKFASEIFKN